jgi:hypothetical protein
MFKKPPFIKLFDFRLNNIEEFVHTPFLEINPILEEKRYFNYWEDHLYKIMNGMWGRDYDKKNDIGGYRYQTGDHYHYTRFFHMRMETEGSPSDLERPILRDFDWWAHYNFIIADGLSGFKDDKVHTCHRFARDHKSFKDIREDEKILLDRYADDILDKYGKFKKYIDPHEYLHMTHREPLGDPLMQNEKQNVIWFASRRMGKTYLSINRMQRGMVVNGAKTIEQYYSKSTKFTGILGSNADKLTAEHLTKFFDSYNKLSEIGSYNKEGVEKEGCFWVPMGGSRALSSYITNLQKEEGGKKDVFWGSQIHRFSFEIDASAGVGVGADFMMGDEIGLWNNVEDVNYEMIPTLKRDSVRFGNIFFTGTGGKVTRALKTKKVFMNPRMIDAMVFKDYCNPANANGCGMFAPVQYTRNIFRDENGNIDLEKSYKDECKTREGKFNDGMSAYIKHISSYCMVYNDIFMQSSSGVLPIDRAAESLEKFTSLKVRERPQIYSIGKIKRPVETEKSVSFVKDDKVNPICNYDDLAKADDYQKSGIVIIYEPPDETGNSKYLTTFDDVKDPTGTSTCIAATWKVSGVSGVRFNLAAESIFRRIRKEDNSDIAINMCLYYGGTFCPETNIPYARSRVIELGMYDILEKSPKMAISQLLNQASKYEEGFYKSPTMNEDVPPICAEILMTCVEEIDEEDGTKKEVWMVDEIPSEFLLNDIIYWSIEGNFDFMDNLFIFSMCVKEYKIRKYFEKPREGNDTFKKVQEAIRDDINITSATDDLFSY